MDQDMQAYYRAIEALKLEPVQGSGGTYHVKNGVIYCGYSVIGSEGFSTSKHYWEIMH